MPLDPELLTISRIQKLMDALPPKSQVRVRAYLTDRFSDQEIANREMEQSQLQQPPPDSIKSKSKGAICG